LSDPVTPAFLGVRQQHRDVDVHATIRVELADGEEAGLAVRQSEDHHVRVFVAGPGAGRGRRVVVVHREGGVETTVGEVTLDGALGDEVPVRLSLRARGQDYAFLASLAGHAVGDGEPVTVAVVDGRRLDSVSTGGFLGLWIGAYATSNGRPTTTTAHLESFVYRPTPTTG
jgi:alpha-N-arabinofuranosidase